jgi:hypothetical protein
MTQEAREKAATSGDTPLEYMLRVMRDESADPDRRDDMAKTAAPYVHGKLSAFTPGGDDALSFVSLLTGMRQSLATKLDRIARTTETSGPEDIER